ncbi:MAG: Gfo/Idh/MocA family protein [Planctomycetia bacterium]
MIAVPGASGLPATLELRSLAAPATVRVGLVGCGAFARFSMARYRLLPGVRITAVADIDAAATRRAADELGAAPVAPDALLVAEEVDLVSIATPPALHFRQARAALEAGKHVLVEKPLATTVADAESRAALAARRGLVCVANLVERYNPLAYAVRAVIRSRLLGDLLHGLFINEAADEGLAPGHWFWDREMSGGIFVEHGVHFFDLVTFWLGAGDVVAAARAVRPPAAGGGDGRAVEEQVVCTCRYPSTTADGDRHAGVLFHFEHGFHQPSRMDRQEMRLVFERGELRLFDWVPTHGEVRSLLDDAAIDALAAVLPRPTVRVVERYDGTARHVRGRFRPFEATALVEIAFTTGQDKPGIYGDVVRELAADQVAWIRDPSHRRRLTEAEGVASVVMACAADRLVLAAR